MVTKGIINGQAISDIPTCGSFSNLGFKIESDQLIFCAADLTDLSTSNPALFTVPSVVTHGKLVQVALTSNVVANNGTHGTPQLLGRLGTTASIAWGSMFRMAIGVINKDDSECGIALCRLPKIVATGASIYLGYLGSAASDSDAANIILLKDSATGWNTKPGITVGYIDATIDNSSGGVITVADNYLGLQDVLSPYYHIFSRDSISMQMPLNQMGAGSGSYFKGANGPTWSSQIYYYRMLGYRSLIVDIKLTSTCTNGTNSTDAEIVFPFYIYPTCLNITAQIGGTWKQIVLQNDAGYSSKLLDATTGTAIQNDDFSSATDYLIIQGILGI